MKRELLKEALTQYASSKTLRYFMRGALEGKDSVSTAKLADIIKTTDVIKNQMFDNMVITDDEGGMWNISEYEAPIFLCQYMCLSRVYFNSFYANRERAIINITETVEEGKILSPSLYNLFWRMYNENQKDFVLPLQHVERIRYTINDFESVIGVSQKGDEDSTMLYIGGSKISRELAYFANVHFSFDGLVVDPCPSNEEVRISLFSGNSNGGIAYGGDHSSSGERPEPSESN